MYKKNGNLKIVFVFKRFVIKFPIIRLKNSIGRAIEYFKERKLLKKLRYYPYTPGSISFAMLRGILECFNEFLFYRQTKHKLCAKTYFSFFGLITIQKKARILNTGKQIICYACILATKDPCFNALHEFIHDYNFGEIDGNIVMVDYGDPKVQEMILKYGDVIYDFLNN
jgi:hypothetical protein